MYPINWLISKDVRRLSETCRHLDRLINEQRDLLRPEALNTLQAAADKARPVLRTRREKPVLNAEIANLEQAATKWLQPYPSAAIRENVKEFLVAVVTILAFTTFFLQLTKIPTGSMQPTLYGITYEKLGTEAGPPPMLTRFVQYWLFGMSYKELTAPFDGRVLEISEARPVFPFVTRQRILFGDPMNSSKRKWLTLWFPPDDRWPQAAGLSPEREYRAGDSIVKLRARTGDHLLVDRFTYNFRPPERGEIIVFKTRGILALPQDVLYIKRLVALPGEKVQISDDQHLIINGRKLTASDRHFENVYTITNPGESHYTGHLNGHVARTRFHLPLQYDIAPLFPDEQTVYTVGPRGYLAMGDNTLNSADSRVWGDLPQRNIIGRCWFIYWPFTDRFGWGYR